MRAMQWNNFFASGMLAVLICGMALGVTWGDDPKVGSGDDALAKLLTDVQGRQEVPEEVKGKVKQIGEASGKDRTERALAMTEVLRLVNPDYDRAANLLGNESLDEATVALAELAKGKDPFVRQEAMYFQAQGLLFSERSEEAMPLLEQVIAGGEYSLRDGEALFLKGLGELMLLDRTAAKKSLEKFLNDYADGPERMRVMAQQQLSAIKRLKSGSLEDVQGRMEFSRRKLALEDTGEDLRKQQVEIISLLEKLIKEAEQQEASGKGSGKGGKPMPKPGEGSEKEGEAEGSGDGESQGGSSGGKSQGKDSSAATKLQRGGPQSVWSQLRDRQRDPVFNAIKEKYPARYQQLIEQYYKSFEDEAAE
ncbi:MAG: tetratricopeptide repeat protein [Planctomycetaceae bacterium]